MKGYIWYYDNGHPRTWFPNQEIWCKYMQLNGSTCLHQSKNQSQCGQFPIVLWCNNSIHTPLKPLVDSHLQDSTIQDNYEHSNHWREPNWPWTNNLHGGTWRRWNGTGGWGDKQGHSGRADTLPEHNEGIATKGGGVTYGRASEGLEAVEVVWLCLVHFPR